MPIQIRVMRFYLRLIVRPMESTLLWLSYRCVQGQVDHHFAQPFSAENHYEAPRYYVRMPNDYPPGFGPTVSEALEG